MPKSIENIKERITLYRNKYPSEEVSLYGDGARPMVHRLLSDKEHYWDIPTTLSTLEKLINTIVQPLEIGNNPENNEWVKHELRNFIGTIEVLLNDKPYKDNVIIVWGD